MNDQAERAAQRIIDYGHHPLQYGFRPGERKAIYDPGDDGTVVERYNRCPNCEQWSPCDVRVVAEAVLSS